MVKPVFRWLKARLGKRFGTSSPAAMQATVPPAAAEAPLLDESVARKKAGDAYFGKGQLENAAACYREAILRNPEYAEAYNNWGNVCRELNLPEDAERHLRTAAALKPAMPNVHYNLASLLMTQDRLSEAIECFAREVAREPTHYAAIAVMLHLKQKICEWRGLEELIDRVRRSLYAGVEKPEQVFSPSAFIALKGTTPFEQRLCAERWGNAEFRAQIEQRPGLEFNHIRPRNDKIAIAYLSADFHDHATARLMAEVFEMHDRERFHVTAYAYGPDDGSTMRGRLENAFDRFVDIRNFSDADAARSIYEGRADILIDLKGLTQNSRSGILAYRPAPRQVNYLGYPGSMGVDFVDYIIADSFVIPPEDQPHYAEKVIYLPDCYQPNDRTRPRPPPPARAECGLPADHVVFCCFNQTYKITSEIFDVWCRLLTLVPHSVLWLYAGTKDAEANLKREAEARGVSPERLVTAPPLNPQKHLARLQCADLFLDTIPVNAHTTCSDALWMGLPVVTCTGKTFASRVAGSLLLAMDMPELITDNLQDYFELALDLARDTQKLAAIRSKIAANRSTAPLFDSPRFTRHLEQAYIQLMNEHPHQRPDREPAQG